MLRYSLGEVDAADAIDAAVVKTLEDGVLTAELMPKLERNNARSTADVGTYILQQIS
jgi:3-isopropylmalate dehydrogenase